MKIKDKHDKHEYWPGMFIDYGLRLLILVLILSFGIGTILYFLLK